MKKVLFILFALLTTTVININADVNGPSPSYAAEREGYSKMYVTAQNQYAHISMVIEDQNFMEYTITSGFYSGGPWVYFVEHGKYKVVSIDKGYRVSCNGSTVQVGSVITFSGATGHIGFYVNN